LKIQDAECQAHVRELARVSIEALGGIATSSPALNLRPGVH
jgi:hypothetical protein